MPQLLPGMDQLLAPAIATMGDALTKILQPDRQFQVNLKNVLAQKPELIQTFADMEKTTPGTLQRMGFGEQLSGMIGLIPESTGSKTEKATSETTVKAAKTKGELDVKTLEATLKLMKDAGISDEAARRILKVDTEGEKKKKAADARTAEAGAITAESNLTVTQKVVKMKIKVLDNAMIQTEDLGNIDLHEMAKQFVNGDGKLNTELFAGVMQREDTGPLLTGLIEQLQEREKMNAQKVIAGMRASSDTVTATTLWNKAYQSYQSANKAGSVDAWLLIHTDRSNAIAKAEEYKQIPVEEQTTEQRDLIAAVEAEEATFIEGRRETARNIVKSLNEAIIGLNRVGNEVKGTGNKDAAIAPYLSMVTDLMVDNAKLGGKQFTVHYGKIPGSAAGLMKFTRDTGIYFTDKNDDVYTPAEVIGEVQATATKSKDHDAIVAENIAFLSGIKDKEERNRRLAELNGTPVYADIRRHFTKLFEQEAAAKKKQPPGVK